MLKQIKTGFFCILVAGFLASCQNDNATRDAAVASASGDAAAVPAAGAEAVPTSGTLGNAADPNAANVTPNAPAPTPVPTGPTTAISFENANYDFGKVKYGAPVTHEYKFKNTGKEPLIISDAKASCGCTVPKWSKEPIAPGGTGSIHVEYDSKKGNGPVNKQVTVTANTNPPQTILYIKGEVTDNPASQQAAPASN